MRENIIKDKSFAFALRIVKLTEYLQDEKKEFVLSRQILRSGTAIGALVREAEHAESKADFISKMSIALKEANETDYWIDLFSRSGCLRKESYESMIYNGKMNNANGKCNSQISILHFPLYVMSILLGIAMSASLFAETGFLRRTVKEAGVSYRYIVYVPGDGTAEKQWPVILYLHGSIERGDDGIKQSKVPLGDIVRKNPEKYPAIIVMPQCRPNVDWSADAMRMQVLAALDASIKEFNGDPDRIYLTGFSMGGGGAWMLAGMYPDRFAALVPVSGVIVWPPEKAIREPDPNNNPYLRAAQRVAHLPIWIFHADADKNVPVTESRRMNGALRALNADVRYTEYKGLDHFICDKAYDEAALHVWLFSQKRKPAPAEKMKIEN